MLNKKLQGFTTIELLIVSSISILILLVIYQLSYGSINSFLYVKSASDNLETKTPTIELLARYFDRWGVGVVTDNSYNADEDQRTKLPKSDRYIYIPCKSGSSTINCTSSMTTDDSLVATEVNPITFYANLNGFGFITSVTGTAGKMIACRINNDPFKNDIADNSANDTNNKCFYVMREKQIYPVSLPLTVININSKNINTFPALDFSISSINASNDKECVDDKFLAASTLEMTANKNISSLSSFEIKSGDLILRSPYRVELFTDLNADDKNEKNESQSWLYVKLTDISTNCNNTTLEKLKPKKIPIAPAKYIKGKLISGSPNNLIQINIQFTGEKYKNNNKDFIVTRVFGG